MVAAAKLLKRSIKWIEDRREHFTNAAQERDQYWSIDIAVDADAKVLGIRGNLVHDVGAYALQDVNIPFNSASMMSGPYIVPALHMDVVVAATNKTPVSSIRGAGYPQAAFSMERLMDLRRARAEARPRRGAAAQSHPRREDALHQAAEGALRRGDAIRQRRLSGLPGEVLKAAGWDDFPKRQAEARAQGRYHRHRPRARHQGHRPRAVRVRHRAGLATPARSRCSPAPPPSGRACAPCWRRSPRASSASASKTSPWCPATPRARRSGSAPSPAARWSPPAFGAAGRAAVAEKAKKLASHLLEAAEHDLELKDGEVRVVGAPQLR